MGAYIHSAPSQQIPIKVILIVAPLAALVAVLAGVAMYLLVFVSMALSMLFLGLPFSLVHLFLRWIGH